MSYKLSERKLTTIPRLLEQIETAEQWAAKRVLIEASWQSLLGTPPSCFKDAKASHEFEIIEEINEPDHRRCEIRYTTLDGDEVKATLLLPNACLNREGKHPAILALHPTTPLGRLDIATKEGRENRMYALELVARGYVVLAPDSITCGSRIYPGAEAFQTAPFYERYPNWTVMGKMLADHQLALDILCSLQEVDGERIGVIGHSLGGYNGWFLAGQDERIRAVASSCGFSMFTEDPEMNRWGLRDWFSHFPSLTVSMKEDLIPFEWHEVAALAAPTPTWMWSGISDRIFPNWAPIAAGMEDLDSLYRWMGNADAFEFWMGNAGHDFPSQARGLAYQFLDRHLKHSHSAQ